MSQISHNENNKIKQEPAAEAAPASANTKPAVAKKPPDKKPLVELKKPAKKRLKSPVEPTKPTKNLYGILYKETGWLVDYSYALLEKFPKKERFGLSIDVKNRANETLHKVIDIISYNPYNNREKLLRALSVDVKTLIALVRVAYKQRCISEKNRDAWMRKLVSIDNLAIGIAMWLEKEAEREKSED
jgi:hypothetical protein